MRGGPRLAGARRRTASGAAHRVSTKWWARLRAGGVAWGRSMYSCTGRLRLRHMAGGPSTRWISPSRLARFRLSRAGPDARARLPRGAVRFSCLGGARGLSVRTTRKRSHARPGGVYGPVGAQLGCAMIARRSRAPTRAMVRTVKSRGLYGAQGSMAGVAGASRIPPRCIQATFC